jgi:hypothetical protein
VSIPIKPKAFLAILGALLLFTEPSAADPKGKPKVTASKADAAATLPRLKGQSVPALEKTLAQHGFLKTKTSASAGKNQTWKHKDGSEVRVHPYGDEKEKAFKSANNAHVHKEDPKGNQLDDAGHVNANKDDTHIGIKNPPDLPQVRGRPHGAGSR